MLKKRLIGVITVIDGWAVQSFGYARHLPLGRPECIAENLDRWGADEIVVLSIDRTRRGLGPDFELVRRLGALGLSTPLTYGGGIRDAADAGAVIQSGADRLCIDATLRRDPASVREIATLVGAQAVVGVLPLSIDGDALLCRDHVARSNHAFQQLDLSLFRERVVSEILLVDWRNEGGRGAFDMRLVERFALADVPLIVFGGVSEPAQMIQLLAHRQVAAVAVGNFLAYREHAIQALKEQLGACPMRPAAYVVEQ